MELAVTITYVTSISIICLFAAFQLYLIIQYRKKKLVETPALKLIKFPIVTVQLPVYNEKYVVERLINAVGALDYPKEKLEIQVLDDSNDETKQIVDKAIEEWRNKGVNVTAIRRGKREGYKAGALQNGLNQSKGEFVAIFDADFLPKPDFLRKTLPQFREGIGMIQTRWTHINKDYNLLTRVQAFGLDAHFTVEQTGRYRSGKLINFNGTAGIWRKDCIVDAGGWKFTTLTEDLDLSYRAQLKGWKFTYLEDVTSPGELPTIIQSVKSQQYRWNKGAAETARQSIPDILCSRLSLGVKLHGIAHLMNSSIFLWLFVAAISSVPLLLVQHNLPEYWLWNWSSIFIFGFLVITILYWTATRGINQKTPWKTFLRDFPAFLILTSGLSLHNSIAVSEGYLGIKSPFIRTPKFNIQHKTQRLKKDEYLNFKLTPLVFFEGLFSIYFLVGIALGIYLQEFGFIVWHSMLAMGFGYVFYRSLTPTIR